MEEKNKELIGPFSQIVTMDKLPATGHISDNDMEVIEKAGIIIENGFIVETGEYNQLKLANRGSNITINELSDNMVLIPGLIDAHTHICFAGSRHKDYAMRLEGKTYLEIARQGGGIMDTVRQTRSASLEELINLVKQRCNVLIYDGVTTCEVKSGYGLTLEDEIKMLKAIKLSNENCKIDLISTCLAAHVCPPEYNNKGEYLTFTIEKLLPEVKRLGLSSRADIYVEETAFGEEGSSYYIEEAQNLGFEVTVHADQFSIAGSLLAAKYKAISADHLEVSTHDEMKTLADSGVIGVVLPGASMGLGMPFAKASAMLDAGMCIAIASDWNPGTGPMGDLLLQAAILGAYEKLSIPETLAGITIRAAMALNLHDRGKIVPGNLADLVAFKCNDYREIVYRQGKLKPSLVWKRGEVCKL